MWVMEHFLLLVPGPLPGCIFMRHIILALFTVCIKTEFIYRSEKCQCTLGPGLKSHAQFHNSYALFPIQCNDDGYFSSPPHLACQSQICQWHLPVLTLPTARVIHIPPAQHTALSLAGWTRPPFAIVRSLQRSHWDVKFFKIKQYTNTFPNT
jgi:hypothetical protein